ncbi:MAG: DUF3667 domain-containing protein [Nannocystaceae bacterium]
MTDTAPSPRQPEPCLNCGTAVSQEFCPACGQRRGDYRKSLRLLLGDWLREALELDGRLGRTLRALLRPGRLTREFNEGRRARFVSPVRLYLFISVIMFATAGISVRLHMMLDPDMPEQGVTIMGPDSVEGLDDDDPVGHHIKERIEELQRMSPADRDKEIVGGALDAGPVVMFFMLPVFAVLLAIVFVGTGRLMVEHLVFSLHLHSVWFLLLIPAIAIPYEWAALSLVPVPIYTVLALRHAYDAGWGTTLLRSVVLGFMYMISLSVGLALAFAAAVLLG